MLLYQVKLGEVYSVLAEGMISSSGREKQLAAGVIILQCRKRRYQ